MNIGFIGAGKMAGALIRGVVRSGVCPASAIRVTDVYPAAAQGLADELGVHACDSSADCVSASDIVVLCVKPDDVPGAITSTRGTLAGKLLVSIVAGLSSSSLAEQCGPDVRIVRTMPNTAALVGQSATACSSGPGANAEDMETVLNIFVGVGLAVEIPEKLLNAVTGLSGSGPAYIFLIIESLAEAGVHAGLTRALSTRLATQTVLGAATLALETGEHPAILREAVTSPGGTTAAGLAVLEAAAVRSAMIKAVGAAAEKACDLGR